MKILAPIGIGDELMLIPDSATIQHRRPMFKPDFGGDEWLGRIWLAVRISRLGKTIAQRFAARYFDAVGLVLTARPALWDNRPELSTRVWACDGTCQLGQWLDTATIRSSAEITSSTQMLATIEKPSQVICEAITRVSQNITLKTGDLILVPTSAPDIPLEISCNYTFALNTIPCLSVRIK